MNTTANKKERSVFLTFLLSLIFSPGFGYLYNGSIKGIFLFLAITEILILLSVVLFGSFLGLIFILTLILITYICFLHDVVRLAKKNEEYELKKCNKWYIYVLYVLVFGVFFEYQSSYIKTNLFEAFKIRSGAMKPTLLIGDHFIVKKYWSENRDIKRGDIVIFTRPDLPITMEDESKIHIVKRVIGLPGEEVEVRGENLFINSKEIEEPYAVWDLGGVRDFPTQAVPLGHVFLMGDNRDHSKDSRFYSDSPFIDIKRIEGKALYIYWNSRSTKRWGKEIS